MIDLKSLILEKSGVKINWQTGEPKYGGLYLVTVQTPYEKSVQIDSWNRDKKQWDTYKYDVKKVIAWFDMEEIIPY